MPEDDDALSELRGLLDGTIASTASRRVLRLVPQRRRAAMTPEEIDAAHSEALAEARARWWTPEKIDAAHSEALAEIERKPFLRTNKTSVIHTWGDASVFWNFDALHDEALAENAERKYVARLLIHVVVLGGCWGILGVMRGEVPRWIEWLAVLGSFLCVLHAVLGWFLWKAGR